MGNALWEMGKSERRRRRVGTGNPCQMHSGDCNHGELASGSVMSLIFVRLIDIPTLLDPLLRIRSRA